MAGAPSTPRLAYIAVMLVAGGFLLLYVVRGGSSPKPASRGHEVLPASDSGTKKSETPSDRSVFSTGDAAAIRAAVSDGMNVTEPVAPGGLTPLHVAVSRGIVETVPVLVAAGADVDARTADGATALMMASAEESLGGISALLSAGASADIRDSFGRTALMLAAKAGKARAVDVLIKAGADVKGADGSGSTALAHAAGTPGNGPVITLLLAASADPELADSEGVTPLMKAAEKADALQVVQLLDAGAFPKSKSKDGRSAFDRAKSRSDKHGVEVAAVLGDAGP